MTNPVELLPVIEPCPFCGEHLLPPNEVQRPKSGLARMHPGSIEDGGCPLSGWGFYEHQLEHWNKRHPSSIGKDELREALFALDELDGSDFEAIRLHSRTLRDILATLTTGSTTDSVVLASTCDGKEQDAFEAWAKAQRFDMNEHPLHYLFLDPRTDAARQGRKAGLEYASDIASAAILPDALKEGSGR